MNLLLCALLATTAFTGSRIPDARYSTFGPQNSTLDSSFVTRHSSLRGPRSVPDSSFVIRNSSFPGGWFRADWLHGSRPEPTRVFADSDLVVGYPDTNQTLVITGNYAHQGRVIVVNNGTLLLDHANFTLHGDITLANNGRLIVQGGTFNVVQHFAYQYNSAVYGNAEFRFDSAQANFNGQSWGNGIADSARLNVLNSRLRNGFTTVSVTAHSHVTYRNSDFGSEYVVGDSSRLSITNCDTALIWLMFPSGSEVYTSLPSGDTTIRHWEFHDSLGVAMGIGYRVDLDTVSGVMWGTFPLRNSVAVLSDSRLRTTGLIFDRSDSVYLTGLVNNQTYGDWQLPVADRVFRLQNTSLATWNLYPFDTMKLIVESCIFGEMLASSAARVTMTNSICDGSGGYIGADAASQVFIINSTVNTQLISRGRAILFAGNANVRFWPPTATSGSIMLFMFCASEFEPQARDTSLIFITDYRIPPDAQTGADVPIVGTADVRHGPAQPVGFGSYEMFYAPVDSPENWHPVDTVHRVPENSDTLAFWDTRGLAVGPYILKMKLKDSAGDSIEPTRGVYLNPSGISAPRLPAPQPPTPALCISPNPSRGPVRIILQSVICNLQSTIEIHDVAGRLIRTLSAPQPLTPAPRPLSSLTWDIADNSGLRVPPGIYFVRVQTPMASQTARVVVLTGH